MRPFIDMPTMLVENFYNRYHIVGGPNPWLEGPWVLSVHVVLGSVVNEVQDWGNGINET